jgi:hypothetical protein
VALLTPELLKVAMLASVARFNGRLSAQLYRPSQSTILI